MTDPKGFEQEGEKPGEYLALGGFKASYGEYATSSIRMKDALPIMAWRNAQISALRQKEPLTREQQLQYFEEVVGKQFSEKRPRQVLLRFTLQEELIGYGGLVHVDWENSRAEASFLLETERARDVSLYQKECRIFMAFLQQCAFTALGLNKITTEAYAHREFHLQALDSSGFTREGTLRQQVQVDGTWVDAIVSSCLKSEFEGQGRAQQE